jgi:DNA-directed RNA polymerase specialized sigma24 family protein
VEVIVDAAEERRFREFVSARSPALMRLAYLLTGGDQHAAEDLLQTALARTVTRWRSVEAPEAYVRQAMYRQQVSWWRRRRETVVAEPPGRALPCGSTCAARWPN